MNLIDIEDISKKEILEIFEYAKKFKHSKSSEYSTLLQDKIIISLFFENSTRTKTSFHIASLKLGAKYINIEPSSSSMNKGESIIDTIETLSNMGSDLLILRDSSNSLISELGKLNIIPIIDGGSGFSSHPTQALLDLFTIQEHYNGKVKGKKVLFVGDIINSRVASSEIKLFQKVGIKILFAGPDYFMPNINIPKYKKLKDIIDEVDIIISLRSQFERHNNLVINPKDYIKKYCITKELIKNKNILILHPGPVIRDVDISSDILKDKRCKILKQVTNGIFIRMASLYFLLK